MTTPRLATLRHIEAGVLDIAYLEYGAPEGWPAVLLHGFPYDVHAYDDVAPRLVAAGARVIVPYLRGYGHGEAATRFLDDATPRSGQQGAIGADLLALLDALGIPAAILGGYDWGGRAACVVAALWPQRVRGLVAVNGYLVQDIARALEPAAPAQEARFWYQYYFHGERGRAGLDAHRRDLTRVLWRQWSPLWDFDDATFDRTATSFDHPDFVDIVIHSYRHRFALAPCDPAYDHVEAQLATRPPITVPAIVLDGDADGVTPSRGPRPPAPHFTARYEHRLIPDAGHNLPQEDPAAFADAVLTLHGWT